MNLKKIPLRIIRNHLNLAIYIILMMKLHLANNFESTNKCLKILLVITIATLSVILIPFAFLLYYFFVIFKLLAIALVKLYLGSKYNGYPKAFDVTFTVGRKTSRQIINYILAIEDNATNSSSSEGFYLQLQKQLEMRMKNTNTSRLLSLGKRYLGYEFYKKECIDIKDYLRQINVTDKEVASRTDFEKAFDIIINNPLPKNDQATWEALLSKQSVMWMENSTNKKYHIIIFRLYHTVGDAACGNKIIHALFADINPKISIPSVVISTPFNKPSSDEEISCNVFKNQIHHRWSIRIAPANILRNSKMSFHRYGAWFFEDDKKYVNLIKNIKNRRKNLTFNSVIIAGISLSLSKFCQKRGSSVPVEKMPLVYVINNKPENLGAYETSDLESITYENNLTYCQINLPIICDKNRNFSKNSDILYVINKIESELELFKKSLDLQIQRWFSKEILDVFPIVFVEEIMRWEHPAFDLSNLPGSKEFTILGNKVKDIIFFTPDMTKFSIGFSCTSYNGRLQLGALVDNATFSSNDAKEILHGLIDAFALLDKATLET